MLLFDADRILHLRGKAIGHTVVIGPEHQGIVPLEVEIKFVEMILYLLLFIERRGNAFVHCAALGTFHFGICSQHLSVCQGHGEGGLHRFLSFLHKGEANLLVHGNFHLNLLVRRL